MKTQNYIFEDNDWLVIYRTKFDKIVTYFININPKSSFFLQRTPKRETIVTPQWINLHYRHYKLITVMEGNVTNNKIKELYPEIFL